MKLLKRSQYLVFLLAFGFLASAPATSTEQHLVTLSDLESLTSLRYLKLSPDGTSLVYVAKGEIWFLSVKSGSTPRNLTKGDSPIWSQDSRRIAYTSKESGALQLWVLDVGTNEKKQVTHFDNGIDSDPLALHVVNAQEPIGHSWSPDGKKLVFSSRIAAPLTTQSEPARVSDEPTGGRPLILTNTTPANWTLFDIFKHANLSSSYDVRGDSKLFTLEPRKVSQLFIADIAAQKVTQLTTDQENYFEPDWAPDGKRIVCISTEGKSISGYTAGPTNIYVIDATTAAKAKVPTPVSEKWLPHWSPDGHWIAFDEMGAGLRMTASVVSASGTNGEVVHLTTDSQSASLGGWLEWSKDSRAIAINYLEGITTLIAWCAVDSTECVKVSVEDGSSNRYLTASRLGTLAWVHSTSTVAGTIRIQPAGTDHSYQLWNLNPQIEHWKLGRQEVVHWKNRHGDERTGILVMPVDNQSGRKFPLIVDGYPDRANVIMDAMLANQAMASEGYGIFYPNPRMPHYWPGYASVHDQESAKGVEGLNLLLDDVMSGVEELVHRGLADPDRMCLYGFSNGGAVVNQLITMTTAFKCGISVAGALSEDWSLPMFLTADQEIPYFAGDTPWHDPERYVKLSAIYRLDKVTTPLLLADGDDDFGFLLGGIEMFNGLRYLGKDVTFLRYPNQRHGFEGEALEDFWRRENAFLAKYLKN